jgi:DMSO/TMAO reductase YedYZ molybdopterin-dependent catalytic subunit
LDVTGLTEEPKIYTYDSVLDHQKYSKVVKLICVEGWSVTILWEGILLRDLLDEARPSPEANTVIFPAYGDYSASHPLSYFYDKDILLAYRRNNVTVPPERGYPFVLVAEDK